MAAPLVVAALSARMLAESARDGGYRPLALDLFGDADTRDAAAAWLPIGDAAALAIDGQAFLTGLEQLRALHRPLAWVAGSGFEGRADLLAEGAAMLPLAGNAPALVERIRDPAWFFARLDALGIAHPETLLAPPADPAGWLCKDAGSSGGWHVRAAAGTTAAGPGIHYQRRADGEPVSALFLANGRDVHVLGVHSQQVRPLGPRPYVLRGCIGPVALAPGPRQELDEMLAALVTELQLVGLNSLDFLLSGEHLTVLELNPRPSASMDLYRDALPGGLLHAHLDAVTGRLPVTRHRQPMSQLRGFEVVFAGGAARLGDAAVAAMAALPWCHDRPARNLLVHWGDPLCSVSAEGASENDVQTRLARRRQHIRTLMEPLNA